MLRNYLNTGALLLVTDCDSDKTGRPAHPFGGNVNQGLCGVAIYTASVTGSNQSTVPS